MSSQLTAAWELFESGDVKGTLRALRGAADELPTVEVAPLVGRLAEGAGFADLAEASVALRARQDARAFYEFGYACVGRGIFQLAVPALKEALRRAEQPQGKGLLGRRRATVGARQVLVELAVALEDGERHGEAVELLQEYDRLVEDWPDRYLLVHNALMAGRLGLAERVFGGMRQPAPERLAPAADRVRCTFARAAQARPQGQEDLRGWHFTLTGGLLAALSPYGFPQMTGRWAYLQETFASCRYGLERLRVVLDATGCTPSAVAFLPDRGSHVLGLAAARLPDVPARPYAAGEPDTLVVAHDLNACERDLVAGLYERAPGQVLYEHVTCWTDTPAVSADVSGLLAQMAAAPWESQLRVVEGKSSTSGPDGRPAPDLAEDILAAPAEPDPGDGEAPADPDALLRAFASRVAPTWLHGPRHRVRSSGPVTSARFA